MRTRCWPPVARNPVLGAKLHEAGMALPRMFPATTFTGYASVPPTQAEATAAIHGRISPRDDRRSLDARGIRAINSPWTEVEGAFGGGQLLKPQGWRFAVVQKSDENTTPVIRR